MGHAPALDGLPTARSCENWPAQAPLYERVLGPAFHTLPAAVQTMHQPWRDARAEGEAEVTGGDNAVGRAIAAIMGFPAPGHHVLRMAFAVRDGTERWTRTFGDRSFTSEMRDSEDQLVERFGPLRFRFGLAADGTGLSMQMRSWSAFGIRLPKTPSPRTTAREWEAEGRFHLDVAIALPLVGLIVRYRGWLAAAAGRSGPTPC